MKYNKLGNTDMIVSEMTFGKSSENAESLKLDEKVVIQYV